VRLVRLAAEERAEVLVFPELSLTGYELDLAEELAFSTDDPRLSPLVEAAAACSTTLVVGAPVRMGSRLHIGALIVSPDGAVALYTKHHLGAFSSSASVDGVVPPPESAFFHSGTLNPLVRLGDGTAAVAICADTGQPSHPREAAERGATTYLASMFAIPSELERDLAKLEEYARLHAMTVAFANYGGPTGGLASGGRSAIWSARGERLVQLGTAGAGVAIAGEGDGVWHARTLALGGPDAAVGRQRAAPRSGDPARVR